MQNSTLGHKIVHAFQSSFLLQKFGVKAILIQTVILECKYVFSIQTSQLKMKVWQVNQVVSNNNNFLEKTIQQL